MAKVIEAVFPEGSTCAITSTLYQHDKGVSLIFSGIELDDSFEVHFSNQRRGGISSAVKGSDGSVKIPSVYLESGDYVYAWVYSRETAGVAATQYFITIPVEQRPAIFDGALKASGAMGYEYDEEEEALIPVSKTN